MRNLTKTGMAIAITAASFVGSTSLAYASGPLYPNQSSGVKIVDSRCEGEVSAASDSSNGNFYARTSVNIGCANGTLELIYIDNSGVERNKRTYVIPGVSSSWSYTQQVINRSQYRQILEVVGGINGHSGSTTCYLFYNPTYVSCG
ncbi:MAG TPA: hypothetical protein VHO01_08845 [Jatrophihabitans sp.]|nr:hypothetical protein [Jatrophihabitans sp.]